MYIKINFSIKIYLYFIYNIILFSVSKYDNVIEFVLIIKIENHLNGSFY